MRGRTCRLVRGPMSRSSQREARLAMAAVASSAIDASWISLPDSQSTAAVSASCMQHGPLAQAQTPHSCLPVLGCSPRDVALLPPVISLPPLLRLRRRSSPATLPPYSPRQLHHGLPRRCEHLDAAVAAWWREGPPRPVQHGRSVRAALPTSVGSSREAKTTNL